jgi:hypothetical protein
VYTFEKPSSKIYDLRDALAKLLIEKGLITKVELWRSYWKRELWFSQCCRM